MSTANTAGQGGYGGNDGWFSSIRDFLGGASQVVQGAGALWNASAPLWSGSQGFGQNPPALMTPGTSFQGSGNNTTAAAASSVAGPLSPAYLDNRTLLIGAAIAGAVVLMLAFKK